MGSAISLLMKARESFTGAEKWLGAESNRRHEDFQSSALPTELPSRVNGERAIWVSCTTTQAEKLAVASTLASDPFNS
jgi:hypothetical protein